MLVKRRALTLVTLFILLVVAAAIWLYHDRETPDAKVSSPAVNRALCRDEQGAANSQGALRRTSSGAIERCDSGRWVPVPPDR